MVLLTAIFSWVETVILSKNRIIPLKMFAVFLVLLILYCEEKYITHDLSLKWIFTFAQFSNVKLSRLEKL